MSASPSKTWRNITSACGMSWRRTSSTGRLPSCALRRASAAKRSSRSTSPPPSKNSPLRHVVDAKEHDVIAVEKLDDLIALVQSGALEVHTRGSMLGQLEVCDRIVFDLDPGEGVSGRTIVAARAGDARPAQDARSSKASSSCPAARAFTSWCRSTAPTGTPPRRSPRASPMPWPPIAPKLYLAKMTKALRHSKIFIDYFRNSREATSVAAYSTRARPGAPVSMPLSWEALVAHHQRQSVHRAQCEEAVARRCVGGDGEGEAEAEAAGAAEAAALIALCCVIPDRRAAASSGIHTPCAGLIGFRAPSFARPRNDRLSALRPFRQPLEARQALGDVMERLLVDGVDRHLRAAE